MKSKISLIQSRTLKIFVTNILIIVLLDFFVSKVAQKYNDYIDEKQNTIEISNSMQLSFVANIIKIEWPILKQNLFSTFSIIFFLC